MTDANSGPLDEIRAPFVAAIFPRFRPLRTMSATDSTRLGILRAPLVLAFLFLVLLRHAWCQIIPSTLVHHRTDAVWHENSRVLIFICSEFSGMYENIGTVIHGRLP